MFLLSFLFVGLCVIGWIAAHLLAVKCACQNRLEKATAAACAAVALFAGNLFIMMPALLPTEYCDYKVCILGVCMYALYMHAQIAKPVIQDLTEDRKAPP